MKTQFEKFLTAVDDSLLLAKIQKEVTKGKSSTTLLNLVSKFGDVSDCSTSTSSLASLSLPATDAPPAHRSHHAHVSLRAVSTPCATPRAQCRQYAADSSPRLALARSAAPHRPHDRNHAAAAGRRAT